MFALSFYIVCFRLSSPKAVQALPAGWNFEAGCLRRLIIDSIRNDPDWKGGEYTSPPRGLVSAVYTLLFMTSSPLQWQKTAPTREAADKFFDDQVRSRLRDLDANDMLYQFESSRDYDPAPRLEAIEAPLLAVNSADDQVNPPELGILEREIRRVRRGKAVVLPITDQTRGHGTHSIPAIWKEHLEALRVHGACIHHRRHFSPVAATFVTDGGEAISVQVQ